jgi:hypothetical protein
VYNRRTRSAIVIDSSFEHSIRRSSRWGIIPNSFWNTRNSLLHLHRRPVKWQTEPNVIS